MGIHGGSILDEKLILNESIPEMYSFLCKNLRFCLFMLPIKERSHFSGWSTVYKAPKFFVFKILGLSKDAEFNVDFKNINLTERKMNLNKVFENKDFRI
jgi:hypothetical protein